MIRSLKSQASAKDETLIALIALERSNRIFLPCGGRFFGDAKVDSDFDLFTYSSQDTDSELDRLGFRRSVQNEYGDVNSVDIFHRGRVTVITVRSVANGAAVQNHIIQMGIVRKKGCVQFWNSLYAYVCGIGGPK